MDFFHLQAKSPPFKTAVLCCARGWRSLNAGLSVVSLSTEGCCMGAGVPIVTVSPSPLPFSMWSHCLLWCRSCSISSQFFRSNCSLCMCRFWVCGRAELRFLYQHLGPLSVYLHFIYCAINNKI